MKRKHQKYLIVEDTSETIQVDFNNWEGGRKIESLFIIYVLNLLL